VLSQLLQRLLIAGPTALGVATLVFALIHATPGDPVDAMLGETASAASRAELRAHLGLDRPLSQQYIGFRGRPGRPQRRSTRASPYQISSPSTSP
jgi:peptide/nickel transport system permease protein